jgi:hypothetical protein
MPPGYCRALHWEGLVTALGLEASDAPWRPPPDSLGSHRGGQIVGLDVDRGTAVRHADGCHG